jgi:DNA-binding NarL/FixJ family response regulator
VLGAMASRASLAFGLGQRLGLPSAMSSEQQKLRVLVADDHPAMRVGLRALLEGDGIEVVAEARNAHTAVEAALRERPDLCLLDVRMPGSGISAAAELSRRLPDMPVVMLSAWVEERDVLDALSAGAAGYLVKDMNPKRLSAAIRGVMRGEAALPRTLTARLITEYQRRRDRGKWPTIPDTEPLTNREREVLELLVEGRDTARVAEQLGVTPVTIRRHISGAVDKLRAADRDEAIEVVRRALSQ